jgi:serine/threonine protein kinase
VKICDFGWSIQDKSKAPRYTFCGTVDYMPPEIILQKSHNSAVDIWCLGVLLYELLHGYPPYNHPNESEKMNQIKKGLPFKFNHNLSYEVCSLIKELMTYEARKRPDFEYIFQHKWVRAMDTKGILGGQRST